MKYAEIIQSTGQLHNLRKAHRTAADHFFRLFNRNRIPGEPAGTPLSPLLSFYQTQTEYHIACAFTLDEILVRYQQAVDETIFE